MKTNVIYGSDNGSTRDVANRIAAKLQGRAVNIKSATANDFEDCELLILGSPTCGAGDLQSDWEDHLGLLKAADLSHSKVALFGTGDQSVYSDTFVDAMGILYDALSEKGTTIVGFTETDGYEFESSQAVRGGKFVGLAIDQDNQSSKTEKRITTWIEQLN